MSTFDQSQAPASLVINGKEVTITRIEIHGLDIRTEGGREFSCINNANPARIGIFLRPEIGKMEQADDFLSHQDAIAYAEQLAEAFHWPLFDNLAPIPHLAISNLPSSAWQRSIAKDDLVWLEDHAYNGEFAGYYRVSHIEGGRVASYDTLVTLKCPLGSITVPARELAP